MSFNLTSPQRLTSFLVEFQDLKESRLFLGEYGRCCPKPIHESRPLSALGPRVPFVGHIWGYLNSHLVRHGGCYILPCDTDFDIFTHDGSVPTVPPLAALRMTSQTARQTSANCRLESHNQAPPWLGECCLGASVQTRTKVQLRHRVRVIMPWGVVNAIRSNMIQFRQRHKVRSTRSNLQCDMSR